jgi:threonine aldolase
MSAIVLRSDGRSDFRSDTVTLPTEAMRAAMAAAEVGDDVLDGDPTVGRLEAAAAEWLGKEGALFVPSGTMANQVALGAWTRPGDELVCERAAHIVNYEAGAAGYLHGLQAVTLMGERGALAAEDVRAALRPEFIHCPKTGVVCLEQTHMGSGGRVVPLAAMEAVHRVCLEAGVPLHLDGARLANAEAASGLSAERWAACAESVSVCFSKALGAPVGSVVAGDAAFLERARVVRKRLGGWMRQAGIIAAGALYALEHHRGRLVEDHELAQALAGRLDRLEGLACAPEEVETNLVIVQVAATRLGAPELAEALKEHDVLVMALSPDTLRFVTHMGVGMEDVERLVVALEEILSG